MKNNQPALTIKEQAFLFSKESKNDLRIWNKQKFLDL